MAYRIGRWFQLEAEADIVGIFSDATSVCIFPVARTIAWLGSFGNMSRLVKVLSALGIDPGRIRSKREVIQRKGCRPPARNHRQEARVSIFSMI